VIEDRFTVCCKACGFEVIDWKKHWSQKYIVGKCPNCGFIRSRGGKELFGYIKSKLPDGLTEREFVLESGLNFETVDG
jgi:predicted RNA-binding Zn-ribbon protein involved in translation (DUF1610 family)